jgi:hypothetical protein
MDRIAPNSDDDDDDQGDLAVPGDGGDQLQPDPEDMDSSQSLLSLWAVLEMTVSHKEKEYFSGCDFF